MVDQSAEVDVLPLPILHSPCDIGERGIFETLPLRIAPSLHLAGARESWLTEEHASGLQDGEVYNKAGSYILVRTSGQHKTWVRIGADI